MSKTNFRKVEESLNEGLLKIKINNIIDSTSTAIKKKPASGSLKMLFHLEHDLKMLAKIEPKIYEILNIKKSQIEALLSKKDALMDEDKKFIQFIKNKLDEIKNTLLTNPQTNEELVDKERTKHINKRFNVNERWLPLS